MAKVIRISDGLEFDNGMNLSTYHESDCCEHHYLSFNDIDLEEFDGLEFDLESDTFFNRIDGYGIELVPISGFTVKIPGYGYNNGYYSSELTLILSGEGIEDRVFDISDCQVIND